jgi:hypothetical protein
MGTKKQLELAIDPKLSPSAEHPARRSADTAPPGDVDSLLLDIYKLTGQKVTSDDPIVLAALFQSRLIERAATGAARAFHDAAEKEGQALAEAVRMGNDRAATLDRSIAGAFQQFADGAKEVGDKELAMLQARFARMASDTLERIRRESARGAPRLAWWKTATLVLAGVSSGMAAGAYLARFGTPSLHGDQIRLLHNGQLLDDAWGRLPMESREMLAPVNSPTPAPSSQVSRRKGTK